MTSFDLAWRAVQDADGWKVIATGPDLGRSELPICRIARVVPDAEAIARAIAALGGKKA